MFLLASIGHLYKLSNNEAYMSGNKALKRLPRAGGNEAKIASKFIANGNTYYIRTPEQGIGFLRYTKLLNMTAVVGYGANYSDIQRNWSKVNEMLNAFYRGENNMGEIFAHVKSQTDGIAQDSQRLFNIVFWVCCLFVVRSDESLSEWDEAYQEEKIQDWHLEGFNEQDFLELALQGLIAFAKGLSES